MSIKKLPSHAIEQGAVIHFFGLNFSAKATDLEKLIVDLGYPNCLYYWPDLERGSSYNHKGWCRVVFVTKETAEKAKIDLSTASLLGRPINIGTITKPAVSFLPPQCLCYHTNTIKSAPRASSVQPASLDPLNLSKLRAEIPKALRLYKHPKEWHYDPEDPGLDATSYMSRVKLLESANERVNVIHWPKAMKNEDGKDLLRSLQFPSPAAHNDVHAIGKSFVYVKRGQGKEIQFEMIDVVRLAEYEAND